MVGMDVTYTINIYIYIDYDKSEIMSIRTIALSTVEKR